MKLPMTQYRPVCADKPCKQCPFRRKAMRGWLGEAKPEEFIIAISMEQPLPCYHNAAAIKSWEMDL